LAPSPFSAGGALAYPTHVRSVLLVDDSEDVREVLRLLVAADGRLQVVGEAVNGREGVEMAERLQPDAIILDVAMPVMTGLEALPLLRERSPRSLVVMYAAGARSEIEPAALAAGAVSYFEKGVSARAVVRGTIDLLDAAAA